MKSSNEPRSIPRTVTPEGVMATSWPQTFSLGAARLTMTMELISMVRTNHWSVAVGPLGASELVRTVLALIHCTGSTACVHIVLSRLFLDKELSPPPAPLHSGGELSRFPISERRGN